MNKRPKTSLRQLLEDEPSRPAVAEVPRIAPRNKLLHVEAHVRHHHHPGSSERHLQCAALRDGIAALVISPLSVWTGWMDLVRHDDVPLRVGSDDTPRNGVPEAEEAHIGLGGGDAVPVLVGVPWVHIAVSGQEDLAICEGEDGRGGGVGDHVTLAGGGLDGSGNGEGGLDWVPDNLVVLFGLSLDVGHLDAATKGQLVSHRSLDIWCR
ncbi:hypothetical protein QBC35DRAFT_478554 [Podospora australis]|uniref:Uncharacterized protein n=1 Tax=Podospora australis TaxID=1536484 RepID=A0AAN6WJZ3_9PEZI|nr:hypothetical protein QBC35DRAFT_478554 [Podospora australis]